MNSRCFWRFATVDESEVSNRKSTLVLLGSGCVEKVCRSAETRLLWSSAQIMRSCPARDSISRSSVSMDCIDHLWG